MSETDAVASIKEAAQGYQLRVVQEVVLALLAKEASHGYQVRARLQLALGPLAEALNAGHVYVTLNRLEKAGLVVSERVGQTDRPDREVYELTAAGRERVMDWLEDTSWPKPAPAEFHLKRCRRGGGTPRPGAARGHTATRAAGRIGRGAAGCAVEPDGSVAGLLLEGVVLRLQADLPWLEACARHWNPTKGRS